MMKMRGLVIAVVVLAALAGGVWWSNKAKKDEAAKSASSASTSPKILTLPEDRIAKVEIRKTGADATVIEKKGGKWELTAPKALAADQDAAGSIASAVAALNADRIIEEKAQDLAQYGLVSPSIEVTVTEKDGKNRELLIGDETPTGSNYYAKLQDDPRVFTIASFTKTTFDKTAADLRDKRLLTFNSDKLTRVELLAKGQDVEFGKNNQNDWQILKPQPLRADGGQVEELVRKLRDAKMDTSASAEDEKKAASGFASGAKVAIAKVTDSSGTEQMEVRRDKDRNYYAKSSVLEGVHKLTAEVGDGLDKSLDDFRNKKVFDFGWNDPSKIEVRDGSRQLVLQKSGDKWMAGGKQMDSATTQAMIDQLRDLAATKFPDRGFTTPALEATVTSNEGKRVERVSFARNGNDWFARREGEPGLYQVDPKNIGALQKAIGAVKEAASAKKK
ncbi:MAG TPA: DUF4340 domain-containing protein [Bryobacteraceae bacterium]|nr:DUF4340 domain-containing protein [Bryobacteraceae bacterium]